MSDLLAAYPVRHDIFLRWGEMDAYQHLNNTIYFRYFEDARIKYFEAIGVHTIKETTGIGLILASTECRFRIPLTHPDTVTVGAKTTKVDKDRFQMEYAIFSEQHQKIAAMGKGVLVGFDYEKGQKTDLPTVMVDAIRVLEGGRV